MRSRLLIVDDQHDVLVALKLALECEDFEVVTVSSVAGALATVAAEPFHAALIDLNYTRDTTSGAEGLDLVTRLRQEEPDLPVIVMTAWASIELVVQAMQAGARDFIEKPWDNHRLLAVVRNQLEFGSTLRRTRQLETENASLRADQQTRIIGDSPALQAVLTMARRVATANVPVLLTGENGTGKSLVARFIHRCSNRRDRPLVEVNAGALTDSVFESEMFGHARGAFTDARRERAGRFELADGGTLFLDEIGNLSSGQQAALLRVLESGEFEPVGSSRTRRVDVRLICATNAELSQLVAQERFREDLLFRVNTVEIRVPELRRRPQDILPIALDALAAAIQRHDGKTRLFTADAIQALQRHAWPGNVRELRSVVERAVLLSDGSSITAADLRLGVRQADAPALEDMSLEDAERTLIDSALKKHGNTTEAARALGLSRSAMYRRMEKLGLQRSE